MIPSFPDLSEGKHASNYTELNEESITSIRTVYILYDTLAFLRQNIERTSGKDLPAVTNYCVRQEFDLLSFKLRLETLLTELNEVLD